MRYVERECVKREKESLRELERGESGNKGDESQRGRQRGRETDRQRGEGRESIRESESKKDYRYAECYHIVLVIIN